MGTHGDQTTTLDVVPQDTVSLVFEDKIAQFYLEFANLVRMTPATPPPPCMSVYICLSVCGQEANLGYNSSGAVPAVLGERVSC